MLFAYWSTRDELTFISELGNHSESVRGSKHELLKGYQQSMKLRHDWGNINPLTITKALEQALAPAVQEVKN